MNNVVVWPAALGGVGVGLVTLLMFVFFGEKLGVSTGFGNLCSLLSQKRWFHSGPYADAPNNWRLWFIVGIPLGGAIAALSSGVALTPTFSVGELYDSVLPTALPLKALWLFAGGILIGIGARLAGGCTSGHAISGIALMNGPSIIAGVCFFAGGIIAVQLIFRLGGLA